MELPQLQVELEGLEFLIARETERDIIEGRYHKGRAAVVQILARKAAADHQPLGEISESATGPLA